MRKKILIVEDEIITAESIKQLVENFGYEVVGITSEALKAISLVKKHNPDLIIMDISLKGDLDGIDVSGKISGLSDAAVIYLTASEDSKSLIRATKTSPFGYIIKPFKDRELIATIEIAIQKRHNEIKIRHLNSVLKAIRGINQLIVSEFDPGELIKKSIEMLVETREYLGGWAILIDTNNDITNHFFSDSMKGGDKLIKNYKKGIYPSCISKLRKGEDSIHCEYSIDKPDDCPMKFKTEDGKPMVLKLVHNDILFGYLGVSIQKAISSSDEELSLLQEVAGDISFALNDIKLKKHNRMYLQELEDEKDLLQALMNNVPDTIYFKDSESRFTRINRAQCQILGISDPKEAIGKKDSDFFSDDFVGEAVDDEKDVLELGVPLVSKIEKTIRKDGEVRWFTATKMPIRNKNNEITGLVGISRDISELIQKENKLRENESKFRLMAENSNDVIWKLDKNLNFSYVSNSISKLTGKKPEKWIGENIKFFFGIKEFEKVKGMFEKALLENEYWAPHLFESEIRLFDRKVNIEVTINQFKNENNIIDGVQGTFRNIDDKIHAKSLLEDKLKFIESLIQTIPSPMFYKDNNQKYLGCNEAFTSLLGLKIEDIVGKKSEDIYDQDFISKIIESDNELLKTGKTQVLETDLKIKSGKLVNVHVYKNIYSYEKGKKGIVGIIWDVTEIKKVNEELQLLNAATNSAANCIAITDLDSKIIWVNPAFTKTYGYTLEELIGESTDIIRSEEHDEEYYQNINQTIKSGQTWAGNITNKSKSGELIYEEMTITPVSIGGNETTHFITIKTNITDKVKTQRQLEASEERFRSIFNNASVGIYRTSPEGKILVANPALIVMLGYSSLEELQKRNLESDGFGNESSRIVFKKLMERDGEVYHFEDKWLKKNGDIIYINESSRAIKDEEGNILYYEGSVEDISESKFSTQRLIEAKELAEKSLKLKSEFLSLISHEIRTPLNAIINFTHLIKEEYIDKVDEDLKENFINIEESGERIIRTVELILNLSEVMAGSFTPHNKNCNLAELIDPLINKYSVRAKEKGLDFRFFKDLENPNVKVDEFSVEQILDQVLDNAVKFTEKGSISVIITRDKGGIMIVIGDTGIGISKEYMKILYEPFRQEKEGYSRNFDGNGLGLVLVKKYCDLNNIKITVESEKAIGTQICLLFHAEA